MLPALNIEAAQAADTLLTLLPTLSRRNSQHGTRENYNFHSCSLIKLSEDSKFLEGIYIEQALGHVHYKVHLTSIPSLEILAADPSKDPHGIVERELGKLLKATKAKSYREKRRKKLLLEGKRDVGGPGANCHGIYVWCGEGKNILSLMHFRELVAQGKATEYGVQIAIKLGFCAVKYPDKSTYKAS